MPWRISGSASTFTASKSASRRFMTSTTVAEKPHCGNVFVPFMKSTIGCPSTMPWIFVFVASSMLPREAPASFLPRLGRVCRERERVNRAGHQLTERAVDEPVLLDARPAFEPCGDDDRLVVVA